MDTEAAGIFTGQGESPSGREIREVKPHGADQQATMLATGEGPGLGQSAHAQTAGQDDSSPLAPPVDHGSNAIGH